MKLRYRKVLDPPNEVTSKESNTYPKLIRFSE